MLAPNAVEMQFFANKKSLPLLPEITEEVMKITRLTQQHKIVASLQMPKDQTFLKEVLHPLAESLYKGYVVLYDTKGTEEQPQIFFSERDSMQFVAEHKGPKTEAAIRDWAVSLL